MNAYAYDMRAPQLVTAISDRELFQRTPWDRNLGASRDKEIRARESVDRGWYYPRSKILVAVSPDKNLTVSVPFPSPGWVAELLERISTLLLLEPNWDGYGAKQIELDAVIQAMEVLSSLDNKRIPLPQIVPTRLGGLQLEWSQSGVNLEIEILPNKKMEGFYLIHDTGEEWAGEIDSVLEAIRTPLRRLSDG